jgi:hypothetical protein
MSDRVIEPSEIIVDQPYKPKENITHVNPWIRCIARFFDYALFFLLLLFSRKFFNGHLPFGKYEHLIPFEYFIWVPIEALLLSTWGTTPGKFFLKTKFKQGKKTRFEFVSAMKRSFSVWMRGMGMGIWGINVLCLLTAYHKLRAFHITSWDRDDHTQVTHYPIGRWRIYVAVFVAAASILYYYSEKDRELATWKNGPPRSEQRNTSSGSPSTPPNRGNLTI